MKIAIVGAGISGLSVAYFLKKKWGDQATIDIYEKNSHVGGWIQTIVQNGFLFEQGPRGFRPSGKGKATLNLIQELSLENELVPASNEAKKRYIFLDGRLQPFNFSFLIKQGLLRAIFRDFTCSRCKVDDETIGDFFRRRFNKRIAERMIDPLVKGIYGGNLEKLSIRSCFPKLWEYDQHGSVFMGLLKQKRDKTETALYSFRKGMQTLVAALSNKIEANFHFSSEISSVEEIDADWIVSTLPMPGIECATLTTVNLGWNGELMNKAGFGFLVPSIEKSEIYGMTWDSQIFPEQNENEQTRICVMIPGEHQDALKIALKNVEHYLNISKEPDAYSIGVAQHAIPQYTLGHWAESQAYKSALPPNIFVLGTSYDGVGVNDCIEHARLLAEKMPLKI